MPRFLDTKELLDEIGWVKLLDDGGGQAGAGILASADSAAEKADGLLSEILERKKARVEALKTLRAEIKSAKKRMLTFYRSDAVETAIADYQKMLAAEKADAASDSEKPPEAEKKPAPKKNKSS